MQARTRRRSQAERNAATRAALVDAARRLFARKGYAATGTPEIVAAARVTRGALYHHFEDKADLFLAVARQAAGEIAQRIARDSRGGPPLDALVRGAEAYFAAMGEQARARLLLVEAPAMLRSAQLAELSELSGARELREGLAAALSSRGRVPLRELTTLVSAAFDRAALAIVNGEPAGGYRTAMRLLLEGLVNTRE